MGILLILLVLELLEFAWIGFLRACLDRDRSHQEGSTSNFKHCLILFRHAEHLGVARREEEDVLDVREAPAQEVLVELPEGLGGGPWGHKKGGGLVNLRSLISLSVPDIQIGIIVWGSGVVSLTTYLWTSRDKYGAYKL